MHKQFERTIYSQVLNKENINLYRDTISGMKTSMELQIQQQLLVTSNMKQIQV